MLGLSVVIDFLVTLVVAERYKIGFWLLGQLELRVYSVELSLLDATNASLFGWLPCVLRTVGRNDKCHDPKAH